ncbi:PIN domain-containing protein [Salinarimonas soli]|uniref:Type II toxin-antitoxin system VapC family toxin n=1 Tax=Salinarimonas soli TaxID=1638099 RepID=A0A5B2VU13_9HYPH|nr:type II toxin-antitoxin system VapC family toxin [Salinarimonas soli]KAA2242274.1 type II toxin-antitoxin system VapC family toxin [Salinarimonas soli]
MIGIDTNLLIRFILQDDPVWSEPAARFLETELSPERPGYVNVVVLAELAWSVRKASGFDRERMAAMIEGLLTSDSLVLERSDIVARALNRYRISSVGFADCLIAELNAEVGAAPTVSIDKEAVKTGMFEGLSL